MVKEVTRQNDHRRPLPVGVEVETAERRIVKSIDRQRSLSDPAHTWFVASLSNRKKWSRQAYVNGQLFDFWYPGKGIAVDIVGETSGAAAQADPDDWMARFGLIVIRLHAFDEAALAEAHQRIAGAEGWHERRRVMGFKTRR